MKLLAGSRHPQRLSCAASFYFSYILLWKVCFLQRYPVLSLSVLWMSRNASLVLLVELHSAGRWSSPDPGGSQSSFCLCQSLEQFPSGKASAELRHQSWHTALRPLVYLRRLLWETHFRNTSFIMDLWTISLLLVTLTSLSKISLLQKSGWLHSNVIFTLAALVTPPAFLQFRINQRTLIGALLNSGEVHFNVNAVRL